MKSRSKTAAQNVTEENNSARKKSGGPRTALGKARSKYNARTHGIFAKVVVLDGESQFDFDTVWQGLREDFEPVGTSEELYVEQLACILWRQQRHLRAEAAEIEMARLSLEWDERVCQMVVLTDSPSASPVGGLVRKIENAESIDVAILQLGALKMTIESEGIDFKRDSVILAELYGPLEEGHWQLDLHRSYEGIAAMASLPEHASKQHGLSSPDECKRQVLQLVDEEMQRLVRFQTDRKAMESRRRELGFFRRSVPESATLDRYATTLERSFDRILSRLDRAQRTRLGKPVTPRVEVNVSHS